MSTMIERLTEEQEKKIGEYREHFFNMATSTKLGNRELVEKAAIRLSEIGGQINCEIKYVANPMEGASIRNLLMDSIRNLLMDSIRDSISVSISVSIRYSLWGSLWYSLWGSLWYSLSASLSYSLRNSFWASLRDSSWTALYSFSVEELGVKCSQEHKEILNLYRIIAENCTAIWILPGTIIICEKPVSVDIQDGKLVTIEWG